MARESLHQEKSHERAVRTAIYARVSTANNGQDSSMQTRELREYCERRGWKFAGEYVDEGISGSKDSRPELNRLMADAHRRRFDAVVVWRFDRFARSVSHLLERWRPSKPSASNSFRFPSKWTQAHRPARWFSPFRRCCRT
jgi:predicted site-specific integrase-resolvase